MKVCSNEINETNSKYKYRVKKEYRIKSDNSINAFNPRNVCKTRDVIEVEKYLKLDLRMVSNRDEIKNEILPNSKRVIHLIQTGFGQPTKGRKPVFRWVKT